MERLANNWVYGVDAHLFKEAFIKAQQENEGLFEDQSATSEQEKQKPSGEASHEEPSIASTGATLAS